MAREFQRYFEDILVGEDLPRLEKTPLTTMHLMRWSAATENWHRIHYDERFAVEHDKLPGLLINGSLKQNFILQLLKNWAGLEGWVWKASFRFRKMDVVGTSLRAWATVTGKEQVEHAYGLVALRLGLVDTEGRESTPGDAVIALPVRGGRVPYPFIPPNQEKAPL
jgi:acyl dehydratase